MWISDIQSNVFTRVKTEATKRLKSTYPGIFFGTSDRVTKEPTFPTVIIKKLQGGERGQTLDGRSVNAVLSSFQIEVTDNVSEKRAEDVADVVCEIMKSMAYNMNGEPFPDNTESVYRNISRYSRIVGSGDQL